MFDNTLIELVQNVRGYQLKYIGPLQFFPEGVCRWLDSSHLAVFPVGGGRYLIESLQCGKDVLQVTEGVDFVVTKAIGWDGTLWTGAKLAACAKELFRVVTDKAGEKRVTTVDISIAEDHLNAVGTSSFEGFSDLTYTGVVKVGNRLTSGGAAINVLEFGCREIGQEDLTAL